MDLTDMKGVLKVIQQLDLELTTITEFYEDACKTLEVTPTFDGFKHWIQAVISTK